MLTEERIKEIENGIKSFHHYGKDGFEKRVLMVGVKNPIYKFINAVVEMNKVNFKK